MTFCRTCKGTQCFHDEVFKVVSTVLHVAATATHWANTLGAKLGHGRWAAHLEFPFFLVQVTAAAGLAVLVAVLVPMAVRVVVAMSAPMLCSRRVMAAAAAVAAAVPVAINVTATRR